MSTNGINKLIPIAHADWAILRDLYAARANLPNAFGLLQTAIYNIAQNPQHDVCIYSLNGDWQHDGTFVMKVGHNFRRASSVFVNTLSDNLSRLIEALSCLDSQSAYTFYGIPESLLPAIRKVFVAFGVEEEFKPVGTFWYHIPRAEVERFVIDPPESLTLSKLDERHAEQIDNLWPHQFPGSIDFVKELIRCNENVGVFDDANQLIAWSLQLPLGSLGVLQVEEAHRRRGLAQLVVRHMAKQLAAKNIELMAPVVFANVASRSLFEKLGAKVVDKAYWIAMPASKTIPENDKN